MDTARHDTTDRLRIAQLTGAAQRLAYPLYRGYDSYDEQTAVAELHGISADPHLLAHAICPNTSYLHDATRALLAAAGADLVEADRLAAWMATLPTSLG